MHSPCPCSPLLDLLEELVRSYPAVLFQQLDDYFLGSILKDWADELPEQGERILQIVLNSWFVVHPDKLPFGDDEFKIIERHDSYALTEFAEKAPTEFLAGATDFFVRCIDMVLAKGREGSSWYKFNYRTYSGGHFGFDQLLNIYRTALKKTAQQQPDKAEKYLQLLDPQQHECLMHLHLEAIQANPKELGNRLLSLSRNEIIFEAGYDGADWLSFANACKAIGYLSVSEINGKARDRTDYSCLHPGN
jgi:hypothetical protein